MKVTIRMWREGEFRDEQVDALPCGVPGLVIHAAPGADGWVITHVPSGCRAAWFPDADPEWVLACAQALGEVGDWTGDVTRLVTGAREVLYEFGALLGQPKVPADALAAEVLRLRPVLRATAP